MNRIILCRPQGPRNVGSILRLMANFGPFELYIVGPIKPSLLRHPDFEQMSHGVEDIASKVQVVGHLDEALAACTASYGFTARARDMRDLADWGTARGELIERCHRPGEAVGLVFGCEENGLTKAELEPLQTLIRFATSDEHTSLNLAMSVGMVLSAVFWARSESAEAKGSDAVGGNARSFLIERLKDVLGKQTTSEAASRDLGESIERVFRRTRLETTDARAWHLLGTALGGIKRPADYGIGAVPGANVARIAKAKEKKNKA
jgi:TrmH family RNA methyltransferase